MTETHPHPQAYPQALPRDVVLETHPHPQVVPSALPRDVVPSSNSMEYALIPFVKINSRQIVFTFVYLMCSSLSMCITQFIWPCTLSLIVVYTVSLWLTCLVLWSNLIKISKEQSSPQIDEGARVVINTASTNSQTSNTSSEPPPVTINLDIVETYDYSHEVGSINSLYESTETLNSPTHASPRRGEIRSVSPLRVSSLRDTHNNIHNELLPTYIHSSTNTTNVTAHPLS